MKVRDLSQKGYKGQYTEALDEVCPCRPCWNPHDFGHGFHCATNYKFGCPTLLPRVVHTLKFVPVSQRKGKSVKCLKCGHRIVLGKSLDSWIMPDPDVLEGES